MGAAFLIWKFDYLNIKFFALCVFCSSLVHVQVGFLLCSLIFPLADTVFNFSSWSFPYPWLAMTSSGEGFSWMCLSAWYSSMTFPIIGEFFLMVCKQRFASDIRWLLMLIEPVQSCRSFVAIYLGHFMTARRAWFWTNWSFSWWTSAALMKLTLPYSNIGKMIDLYRLIIVLGSGFLESDDRCLRRLSLL